MFSYKKIKIKVIKIFYYILFVLFTNTKIIVQLFSNIYFYCFYPFVYKFFVCLEKLYCQKMINNYQNQFLNLVELSSDYVKIVCDPLRLLLTQKMIELIRQQYLKLYLELFVKFYNFISIYICVKNIHSVTIIINSSKL